MLDCFIKCLITWTSLAVKRKEGYNIRDGIFEKHVVFDKIWFVFSLVLFESKPKPCNRCGWLNLRVSIGNSMIFGINTTSDISKLYINSRLVRQFWNIMYNSCYYFFILQPEKCSHITPCVYFRRVVSLRRREVF